MSAMSGKSPRGRVGARWSGRSLLSHEKPCLPDSGILSKQTQSGAVSGSPTELLKGLACSKVLQWEGAWKI